MNVARALALVVCASSLASLTAACGASPSPDAGAPASSPPSDAPPALGPPTTDRRTMSTEDCAAKGGNVVGDIGDGAIHRPEYRCPSGSPPIGDIALGVEGSVCCT